MTTENTDNYFELYGLPVNFKLDTAILADRHRELMSKFHPDKFSQSDGLSKRQAAQMAASLNESYAILKSPLNRAGYMLGLVGLDDKADSETSSDGAFLMQQLELREQIEEASNSSDPFAVLENTRTQATEIETRLYKEFEQLYNSEQFDQSREAWVKLKFFTRLHGQIDRAEQQLEDQ